MRYEPSYSFKKFREINEPQYELDIRLLDDLIFLYKRIYNFRRESELLLRNYNFLNEANLRVYEDQFFVFLTSDTQKIEDPSD